MADSFDDAGRPALPVRKHPAHGVIERGDFPPLVFLTVCTQDRSPWLTSDAVHDLLQTVWTEATAWRVGRYVLMPDHLHLFCAPGRPSLPLDNWVRYWKSQYSRRANTESHIWHTDHWDTRMRSWEHYAEKWQYVRYNPVRKKLAARPEDWRFRGELHKLY